MDQVTNTISSVSKVIEQVEFKALQRQPIHDYLDYTRVSFKSILTLEEAVPCDIFIKINQSKYTKIISAGTQVDHLRLIN